MGIETGNLNANPNGERDCVDIKNSNEIDWIYPPLKDVQAAEQQLQQLQQQQQQSCVLQPTTVSHRSNGHSRNPSSINGITIATQVIQPPPNKPDAINYCLNIFQFHHSEGNEKFPKRQICGIREARLFMMFIFIIVLLISATVFFVMWFTEIYNDQIASSVVLARNSTALKFFQKPPVDPQLRVHIFNYTNAQDFVDGRAGKLIVEDIGPFVYTERAERVNVTYNDNNTISYREHREFDFQPSLSTGRQFDTLTVPNIPFLSVVWKMNQMNFLEGSGARLILFNTSPDPFVKVAADSFLWGYNDKLYNELKTWSPDGQSMPEKFGMLATRKGTSIESFTINSGVDDIKKLNVIDNFNGMPDLNFWSTAECNHVDGTDGSQFPPHLMESRQPLEVFIKAFCRKFPMAFEKEVNLFNGVPALRYKAPRNVFDSPDKNPENQCYCDISSGSCPPSGVFNATLCFKDAPIFASFPHFLYGDKKLFEKIEGLSPNEDDHLTYADLHARLAFPMAGSSRFQINIEVHKNNFRLEEFQEKQILPVMWMEVTSSEVPERMRAIIYHSTFSANAIQLSLKYGSMFGLAISITILIAGCYLESTEAEQIARSKGINQTDRVTREELMTIVPNDHPLRPLNDTGYPVAKE